MTEQDNVEQEGRVESDPEPEAEEPAPLVSSAFCSARCPALTGVMQPEETPVEKKTPLWKRLSQRTGSRMDGNTANHSGFLSRWNKNKDNNHPGRSRPCITASLRPTLFLTLLPPPPVFSSFKASSSTGSAAFKPKQVALLSSCPPLPFCVCPLERELTASRRR
eukprot:1819642-Rhodomonas_salina.1